MLGDATDMTYPENLKPLVTPEEHVGKEIFYPAIPARATPYWNTITKSLYNGTGTPLDISFYECQSCFALVIDNHENWMKHVVWHTNQNTHDSIVAEKLLEVLDRLNHVLRKIRTPRRKPKFLIPEDHVDVNRA